MPLGNLVVDRRFYDQCTPELRELFGVFIEQGSDVQHSSLELTKRYQWRMDHPDFLPDDEDGEYILYVINRYDLHHRAVPTLASLRRIGRDGRQRLVKMYLAPSVVGRQDA